MPNEANFKMGKGGARAGRVATQAARLEGKDRRIAPGKGREPPSVEEFEKVSI